MYKTIYIHKKNIISFSYHSYSLNKYNFNKYNLEKMDKYIKYNDTSAFVNHIYQPMTLNNQYHNINIIKDGIYKVNDTLIATNINVNELYNLNIKSSDLYSFVMKLIYLNTCNFSGKMKYIFQTNLLFIRSSFQNDILNINMDYYYEIHIKNKHNPIYVQENAIVYDKTGFAKKILDIVGKVGRRSILGVDNLHNIREYEIEKVILKNPIYEMKNKFDVQYLEFGLRNDNKIYDNSTKSIIIDNIIVNLD